MGKNIQCRCRKSSLEKRLEFREDLVKDVCQLNQLLALVPNQVGAVDKVSQQPSRYVIMKKTT